jgi:hypothetical protein
MIATAISINEVKNGDCRCQSQLTSSICSHFDPIGRLAQNSGENPKSPPALNDHRTFDFFEPGTRAPIVEQAFHASFIPSYGFHKQAIGIKYQPTASPGLWRRWGMFMAYRFL